MSSGAGFCRVQSANRALTAPLDKLAAFAKNQQRLPLLLTNRALTTLRNHGRELWNAVPGLPPLLGHFGRAAIN